MHGPPHIVVARFDEDLGWLLPAAGRVTVINKGPALSGAAAASFACLSAPNVGREGDSYLRYLLHAWHDLPPVVVFTQARVSDHLPPGADGLAHLDELGRQAAHWGASPNKARHDFGQHSAHANFKLASWRGERLRDSGGTLAQWYARTVGAGFPAEPEWWQHAIFAVRRDLLRVRGQPALLRVLASLGHANPEEAHFLERAWAPLLAVPDNDALLAGIACAVRPMPLSLGDGHIAPSR